MGALAPIANLIGFSTGGTLGAGGNRGSSTPPISNFFGIDPRFLAAPATSTAIFNNVLFGSSNQQVPIDFMKQGFYTGIPPVFGGQGFPGLPPRFDFFGNTAPNQFGLDGILQLERSLNPQPIANNLGGLGNNLSLASLLGDVGAAGSAEAPKESADAAKKADQDKQPAANADAANIDIASLKSKLAQLSLTDLLKLWLLS